MCHWVSGPPSSGTSSSVEPGSSMNMADTSFLLAAVVAVDERLGVVGVEHLAVGQVRPVDVVLVAGDAVADAAEAVGLRRGGVGPAGQVGEGDRDDVLGAGLLLGRDARRAGQVDRLGRVVRLRRRPRGARASVLAAVVRVGGRRPPVVAASPAAVVVTGRRLVGVPWPSPPAWLWSAGGVEPGDGRGRRARRPSAARAGNVRRTPRWSTVETEAPRTAAIAARAAAAPSASCTDSVASRPSMKLMPLVLAMAQPPTSRGVDRGAGEHEPAVAPDEGQRAPAELEHRDDEEGRATVWRCAGVRADGGGVDRSGAQRRDGGESQQAALAGHRRRIGHGCGHGLPLGPATSPYSVRYRYWPVATRSIERPPSAFVSSSRLMSVRT